MKKCTLFIIIISFLASCKGEDEISKSQPKNVFTEIKIDTIFEEDISIRAIIIDSNKVWFAANKGKYGFYDLKNEKTFVGNIAKDTLPVEFRSIAKTQDALFILSVGNPALLYKVSKDGLKVNLVYQENNERVFYDSMHFWNDNDGIAMGDPTENCLSVLITKNGGKTWEKMLCDKLPKTFEGEAAFAASNTSLVVKKTNAWMVSGGKEANIYFSFNLGKNWKKYKTPIIQGKTMTGIFSADFYDEDNGIIVGGDYEKPNQNFSNKAITRDGGKTWNLIDEKKGFGYASCVQYVPNSNAEQMVTVGATGIFYSADYGKTWQKLSNEKQLHTIRFQNDSVAFAAGNKKIIRIAFKK